MSFLADFVVDVREMRKMEDMLEAPDRTVMAFKDSHLSAVGSVAVAAAIVSQLSSTTLQLPGLSHVHWTAPGSIIASLLFGVLAVILATVQQQVLGMLNNPDGVRMWLSSGRFYPAHHALFADAQGKRRLQVSIAALQLLALPHKFLTAAVVCFLAGFALYLGFAFRQDLDDTPARSNNQAVFILFVALATLAVAASLGISLWKMWEVRGAESRWERDSYGDDESSDRFAAESEESGYEADESQLLASPQMERLERPRGKKPVRRWSRHDEIAGALEEAARLHKRVARLMREQAEELS